MLKFAGLFGLFAAVAMSSPASAQQGDGTDVSISTHKDDVGRSNTSGVGSPASLIGCDGRSQRVC